MTVRMTLAGLDQENEDKIFASKEIAIAYAAWWFLSGYINNGFDHDMASIMEDAGDLVTHLTADGKFYCGRFYETIIIYEASNAN